MSPQRQILKELGAAGPLNSRDVVATMDAVAGPFKEMSPDDEWLAVLADNPQLAHTVGYFLQETDVEFAAAFPGETREQTFTNDQWKEAGFQYVARENELMGLTES